MKKFLLKRKTLSVWLMLGILLLTMAGCGSGSSAGGSLKVGDTAPDFTAQLADGTTFHLADAQGKVVILNLWATWCGSCRDEMPAFEKLYAESGDDIQIIAVNVTEPMADVDAFIKETGYTFPIAYDLQGEIVSKYPTIAIPYTVVINADGVITYTFTGEEGAEAQYGKFKHAIEKTEGNA